MSLNASLVLEDGTVFPGTAVGAPGSASPLTAAPSSRDASAVSNSGFFLTTVGRVQTPLLALLGPVLHRLSRFAEWTPSYAARWQMKRLERLRAG